MNKQPYKYEVIANNIFIVDGFTDGFNVFSNLQNAKEYACKHLTGIHVQELSAYKERIRAITKQDLFDEFFEYHRSKNKEDK